MLCCILSFERVSCLFSRSSSAELTEFSQSVMLEFVSSQILSAAAIEKSPPYSLLRLNWRVLSLCRTDLFLEASCLSSETSRGWAAFIFSSGVPSQGPLIQTPLQFTSWSTYIKIVLLCISRHLVWSVTFCIALGEKQHWLFKIYCEFRRVKECKMLKFW